MFISLVRIKKTIAYILIGSIVGVGIKSYSKITKPAYNTQNELRVVCDAGHGGYGKCFKLKSV